MYYYFMPARTKEGRSAAAKKAARTRKKNRTDKNRKKGARKAINRIKKFGSRENFKLKLDVGKKLSKKRGDTLQCQCCLVYFKPHFIDIDHKFGRHEITDRKSLQKINYSEGRSGKGLSRWVLTHIEKPIIHVHFQILCHNCNRAKFLYKTCPHQRKRNQ